MTGEVANHDDRTGRTLSAYLLGRVTFDEFLALQRRLVYEIGGDRTSGAVILCEHPPGVTIGREGSRAHIRPNFDRLIERLRPVGLADGGAWTAAGPRQLTASRSRSTSRQSFSPVRWVSRGGGVLLHVPGQVACYPILPLEMIGLTPAHYVGELQQIALELLRRYRVAGTIDPERPGIRANGRRIVHVGVAVRDRITGFGLVANVNPNLELFHHVHCDGDPLPMTSLQRESPDRVRIAGVRQHLLELVAARFAFARISIFHTPPFSS